MARVFQLDRSLICKIEGRVSETLERLTGGEESSSIQRPIDFVADAAGVSRSTAQRWIRDARRAEYVDGRTARDLLMRDFGDSFDALCRASVTPIERSMIGIASDRTHPRCVDAAKYMLPRLDPLGHGPAGLDVEPVEPDTPAVGSMDQAVIDALTDLEMERLDQLSAAMAELERECAELLHEAAKRAGVESRAFDGL